MIPIAWFKVDDGLHSSRKLLSIPRRYRLAALGLWTISGSWSSSELTDGMIPDYMIDEWGGTKVLADWLVKSGLWRKLDVNYSFHNWAEYQPTKADIESARKKNAEKLRLWRDRNRGVTEGVTGLQDGSKPVSNPAPDPTRPDPTPIKESARKRGTRLPDDWTPSDDLKRWTLETCPGLNGAATAAKFRDYWHGVAGAKGVKLDWDGTWRNWCRREYENGGGAR